MDKIGVALIIIQLLSFSILSYYALNKPVDEYRQKLLIKKTALLHCSMPEKAVDHYLKAVWYYKKGDIEGMKKELDMLNKEMTKNCSLRLYAPNPAASWAVVYRFYENKALEAF